MGLCGLVAALVAGGATSAPAHAAPRFCEPLPPPGGHVVTVANVPQLVAAVDNAVAGDTILLADGIYALDGVYLRLDVPGVTLRSASGDRDAVVLDGNYLTTEIVQIVASDVTVAELTLREAYDHPVHVQTDGAHTTGTLIYGVHIVDPGQQAIKINPGTVGFYADDGTIACSHVELTAAGRAHVRDDCYTGGIDAHQARGWSVRDNVIEGFWCASGLSEHAVHFWRGSRDTLVERNRLRDNARGVGFGLATSGVARTYPDAPCPGVSGYVDHYGGVVRNNFVSAADAGLFTSEFGFDCGVCLWQACRAAAVHNTVFSTQPPFSSIEWRFAATSADVVDNLVNYPMRARDGAQATQAGNVSTAQASWFAAAGSGELHLVTAATGAIDQAVAWPGVTTDADGQPRTAGLAADVGADEYAPFVKGDFDRDGRTDLLFRHAPTGRNEAWVMSDATRAALVRVAPPEARLDWRIVGVDDFDGDLRSDLVWWNAATGAVEFWLLDGVTRRGAAVALSGAAPLPTNWRLAATGDFDHDGWPDLLWRNVASQKLVVWTMNGTSKSGNIVPTPDQAVDGNWEVVAALDYDGDGQRDLLWYNTFSGKIVQWLMDAAVRRVAGRFTNPPSAGNANWKVLASGDYGLGDGGAPGTNDVVWRNATSGRVVVWHLDTSGARTAGEFTTPDAPAPNPTDWTIVGPR